MKISLPSVLRPYRNQPFSVKRRLVTTFILINALFAIDVALYLWSNAHRNTSINDLQNAVVAEKTLLSVRQSLNNIQRQVTLLGQSMESGGATGPEELAQFKEQLQAVRQSIDTLAEVSTADVRKQVQELSSTYTKLSASWVVFYENNGIHHAVAITEIALRADPLSQEILDRQVPALLEAEKRNVEAATANYHRVARLTDRMTLIIFALSGLIAASKFFILSRDLTRSLGELKLGAAAFGAARLDHRISLPVGDELGDLASTFNEMAGHLGVAKEQLHSALSELESRNQQIDKQRRVSEGLLLNILPVQIADELRQNESVEPKYFEDVTILFTDFVGFTLSTEKLAAEDLVHRLNDYFTAFDQITARYGIEKLKTIGDAYMCVAGMPVRSPSHPVDMVLAAFEMVRAVEELSSRSGGPNWAVRVGIHTGPVIAGVVGIHKFAFDIWGESVNYSSRMESSGAANRINLSERTHSRVKDFIACQHRGKVLTKDKREVDMFFANGVLPQLMDDTSQCPAPAFVQRYRTYFQKEPQAFPAFLAGLRTAEACDAAPAPAPALTMRQILW